MQKTKFKPLIIICLFTFVLVFSPFNATTASVWKQFKRLKITKILQAKVINITSLIKNTRGDVKIDDNLRVTGDIVAEKTIDGVDLSDLKLTVDNLNVGQLDYTCTNGQVLKYNTTDSLWDCADDVDTDTNTAYTAGTNITITDGVISATDTDTTYTAGSGLTLNGLEFSADLGESIESSEITDNTILNNDLAGNIGVTKIAAGTNGQVLLNNSGTNAWGALTDAFVPDALTIADGTIDNTPIGNSTASTVNASNLKINNEGRILQSLSQIPKNTSINTIDDSGDMGQYSSITIGIDGFPVISYYDNTDHDLKFVKCGNAACSAGNTLNSLDTTDDVGKYTSIAIGADGFPVIAYYDVTNSSLKVAHCANASCSSSTLISAIESDGDVGKYTSIAIGADGFPVIAYYDDTNDDLRVAHCTNDTCSSSGTQAVDTSDTVGLYSSIAIGNDGLPIISYIKDNGDDSYSLKTAKCGDANCSAGNTLYAIDGSGATLSYSSIVIGNEGLPFIAYQDNGNWMRVVKCARFSCASAFNTSTAFVTNGNGATVGMYISSVIGADGLPIISYYDSGDTYLHTVKCMNESCNDNNNVNIITVDNSASTGFYNSMTIGADGNPIIAYYDSIDGDLMVAKAANVFFTPYWTRK